MKTPASAQRERSPNSNPNSSAAHNLISKQCETRQRGKNSPWASMNSCRMANLADNDAEKDSWDLFGSCNRTLQLTAARYHQPGLTSVTDTFLSVPHCVRLLSHWATDGICQAIPLFPLSRLKECVWRHRCLLQCQERWFIRAHTYTPDCPRTQTHSHIKCFLVVASHPLTALNANLEGKCQQMFTFVLIVRITAFIYIILSSFCIISSYIKSWYIFNYLL